LPNDHQYGIATTKSESFEDIIKNKFADDRPPDRLLNLEATYKPHLAKNRLKPPKPTNSTILRASSLQKQQTAQSWSGYKTTNVFPTMSHSNLKTAQEQFDRRKLHDEVIRHW
jgi:hypothetical protein